MQTDKRRIIDTHGQFVKLFPSYARCIDMTKDQHLELVEAYLVTERRLSDSGHWAYELNRHLALVELRDALKVELMEMAHA